MAAPRQRHWISPARTGSRGQPLTKAEQTSVPPLVDTGQTCAPTASRIQWKVSGGSGEPVEAMARSAERSWRAPGERPAFAQAVRYPALVPCTVAPVRATTSNWASSSGWRGLPS
jgi:hypothetical protein